MNELIILINDLDREIEAREIKHDQLMYERIPELERKLRRAQLRLEMNVRTTEQLRAARARANESLEKHRKEG